MDGVSRSGYPDDQEVAAGAKAWVDSVEGKWRVQIFARRSRVLRDGSSREIPSRLRRFVEGIPWAFVRPAVDYLISKAPYSGVIANGVDFGVTYRPTLTMWQRDSQQAAVGAKGASVGDATYTLVQDLVEADSDDVYTVGTSSSCSEEVVSRYVWDAASVEELPQGGMGVTYQVAQVHRNEDGSFDYALVKRVAITQHVGPVTQEDNAYRQVSVETWDNVYVRDDGVFCDSSWNPIAGIAAGVGDVDGRRVETKVEQVSENDDCTVRLSVTRTWLKPVTAQTETRNTQFESDRSVVTSGNDGSLGDAPDASDGVIVTHASELQPDGTYRNTVKTETERPVAGSRREVSRTSRAVRTVVHDANQAAPAPTEGLAVGQTVVVESTPGRLFNNTVTNVEAAATPDSARCAKTVFSHEHDAVTLHSGGSASDVLNGLSCSDAGGGVYRTVTADMDENGVVKRVERVTHELSQPDAEVRRERTSRATRTTVVNKNAASGYDAETPVAIGETKASSLNPGGTYDTTHVIVAASETPDSARCAKTVFSHEHDAVTLHSGASASDVLNNLSCSDAGGGVYRTVTADMDENGVVKRVERVTHESYFPQSEETRDTDAFHSALTVKDTHASASSGGSVYDDVAATIGASPSGDSVSDSDPVRTNSVSVKTRAVSAATQGGSRDVVKVTDTPLFRQWYDYLDTDLYKTFVFYFRNATTAQRNVVRNRATAKWNELRNLYGGVKGSLDLTAAEAAAVGQMVILKSGAGYRYAVKHDDGKWYIGTNEVSGTDLDDINKALKGSESDTSELSGTDRIWAGGPKTPTSARITPSCTLNEHGLFDGHYTIELAWSPESGGSQVDHVNGNVALAKWTYRVYSCSYSVRTFGSNGNNMEIVKTAQSKLVAEEMVTGWKSYVNRCFGPNNLLFEGSHVSVTPSTGVAHGVRVLEADTVIEKFETRSQWVKEGWGKVLPWNKIIMRPATITLDDSVSGGIGGV